LVLFRFFTTPASSAATKFFLEKGAHEYIFVFGLLHKGAARRRVGQQKDRQSHLAALALASMEAPGENRSLRQIFQAF
jgi:hypothetical protein